MLTFAGIINAIGITIFLNPVKLYAVSTFVMVYNLLLYIICGCVLQSWILPLYSIVTYMAALKTVDFIVEGFDRAKSAMIITDKPDEICKELSSVFETGTTKIDSNAYITISEVADVFANN